MKLARTHQHVEMIQIENVHVLNPRSRNKRIHGELIENIRLIGLKRPITVSRKTLGNGALLYDLVCGQGRLEAFIALGQSQIPAFVTEASEDDCLVMSLVENVARRKHRPIDQMREIGRLHERGHSDVEVARRIGVTSSWVNMVTGLLDRGEEKLLAAVDRGIIPVSMATVIARSSEAEIQNLRADAYTDGFRGKRLATLRRLLEARSTRDKLVRSNPLGARKPRKRKTTPADLRNLFEREAEKQRLTVKKAAFTHDRLVFATQAIKELLALPAFCKLLQGQKLGTLPRLLASRMRTESVV